MTLATIQADIATMLTTCDQLTTAQVKVLAQNRGDIMTQVAEAVGKIGIIAIVLTPRHTAEGTSAYLYGTLSPTIRIVENPIVNRRRPGSLTALDAAEIIATTLHMQTPTICNSPLTYTSIDEAPIPELAYDVTFTTRTTLGFTQVNTTPED